MRSQPSPWAVDGVEVIGVDVEVLAQVRKRPPVPLGEHRPPDLRLWDALRRGGLGLRAGSLNQLLEPSGVLVSLVATGAGVSSAASELSNVVNCAKAVESPLRCISVESAFG